jgi:hypothetical protein
MTGRFWNQRITHFSNDNDVSTGEILKYILLTLFGAKVRAGGSIYIIGVQNKSIKETLFWRDYMK